MERVSRLSPCQPARPRRLLHPRLRPRGRDRDGRDPPRAFPGLPRAGALVTRDAGARSGLERPQEEARERSREAAAGADEALPGTGHQSDRRMPSDGRLLPSPLRHVRGVPAGRWPVRGARAHDRAAQGCRALALPAIHGRRPSPRRDHRSHRALAAMGLESRAARPSLLRLYRPAADHLPLLQLVASVQALPRNPPQTDDPTQRTMQSMTYYLPLITIVFFRTLASGVFIYYITTTIFQIIQQYFVMGWGQLPRWIPPLANIPTPADKTMRAREQAAIAEAEHDMEEPEAVGASRRNGNGGGRRRRGRRRKR